MFAISLLALCWYAMMAVHEGGHVLGALVTGGTVERVVLHPLTISRTDVSPNPHPGIVVWAGPIVGCVVPLTVLGLIPRRLAFSNKVARFFTGFCLIANGAYIAIGSFDAIGDCAEMLRTGTPQWGMLSFGAVTVPLGLYLWHTLGSLGDFFRNPTSVRPSMACLFLSLAIGSLMLGAALSPY